MCHKYIRFIWRFGHWGRAIFGAPRTSGPTYRGDRLLPPLFSATSDFLSKNVVGLLQTMRVPRLSSSCTQSWNWKTHSWLYRRSPHTTINGTRRLSEVVASLFGGIWKKATMESAFYPVVRLSFPGYIRVALQCMVLVLSQRGEWWIFTWLYSLQICSRFANDHLTFDVDARILSDRRVDRFTLSTMRTVSQRYDQWIGKTTALNVKQTL